MSKTNGANEETRRVAGIFLGGGGGGGGAKLVTRDTFSGEQLLIVRVLLALFRKFLDLEFFEEWGRGHAPPAQAPLIQALSASLTRDFSQRRLLQSPLPIAKPIGHVRAKGDIHNGRQPSVKTQ